MSSLLERALTGLTQALGGSEAVQAQPGQMIEAVDPPGTTAALMASVLLAPWAPVSAEQKTPSVAIEPLAVAAVPTPSTWISPAAAGVAVPLTQAARAVNGPGLFPHATNPAGPAAINPAVSSMPPAVDARH